MRKVDGKRRHILMSKPDHSQRTVGEATVEQWQEECSSAYLEERLATLFDAIAHGSAEHRAWLRKAIDDHFAMRPVEPVRG